MFVNREEAGLLLANRLKNYKAKSDALVLGIPRGGVVVANKISKGLGIPMDIVVVKKIGAPDNPELAIGAVGPKSMVYWDKSLLQRIGASKLQITNYKLQIDKERGEREKILRGKKPYNLKDKVVILVDDGVATGATVLCAQMFLKKEKAKKIILAVPVIAKDTLNNIKKYFDRVIALESPHYLYAVGQFYSDFPQVDDDEVIKILNIKD